MLLRDKNGKYLEKSSIQIQFIKKNTLKIKTVNEFI